MPLTPVSVMNGACVHCCHWMVASASVFSSQTSPTVWYMILQTCRATIGMVSNIDHSLEKSGKAGRSRWLGRRPRTRGVAMNPVDHPMGGGEGRASGGHPRSRKGLPAKGYKTRNAKKDSGKYIIEKRKK